MRAKYKLHIHLRGQGSYASFFMEMETVTKNEDALVMIVSEATYPYLLMSLYLFSFSISFCDHYFFILSQICEPLPSLVINIMKRSLRFSDGFPHQPKNPTFSEPETMRCTIYLVDE